MITKHGLEPVSVACVSLRIIWLGLGIDHLKLRAGMLVFLSFYSAYFISLTVGQVDYMTITLYSVINLSCL